MPTPRRSTPNKIETELSTHRQQETTEHVQLLVIVRHLDTSTVVGVFRAEGGLGRATSFDARRERWRWKTVQPLPARLKRWWLPHRLGRRLRRAPERTQIYICLGMGWTARKIGSLPFLAPRRGLLYTLAMAVFSLPRY